MSCEHGGAHVPAAYAPLFADADAVLGSHRGFDAGAYELAQVLARRFGAPLHASRTTRLLVDLNRSLGHKRLYSEYTVGLPAEHKVALLAAHYFPYREAVEQRVGAALVRGSRVIHVSAHSFTPVMDRHVRRTDVGLLYDPARPHERALAEAWRGALRAARPDLCVHRNRPYRGVADGLVTYLRRQFPADRYVGFELEINQRFVGGPGWKTLLTNVAEALAISRMVVGAM